MYQKCMIPPLISNINLRSLAFQILLYIIKIWGTRFPILKDSDSEWDGDQGRYIFAGVSGSADVGSRKGHILKNNEGGEGDKILHLTLALQ